MSSHTIDFSKYEAQAPAGGNSPIDFSKYEQPEAQPKEGFLHSLGSVFGYTPEKYTEAKQRTDGMSPLREAWETTKPPNPLAVTKSIGSAAKDEFSKGSEEGAASYDSMRRGDFKGALAHQVGQIGYAGATLGTPVFGNNLSKAGEQFGEGNFRGGAGTTAGVVAPFVAPAVGDIPVRKIVKTGMAVNEGIPVLHQFNKLAEAPGKIRRIWSDPQAPPVQQGTAAGPVPSGEAPVPSPVVHQAKPVARATEQPAVWPPERPSVIQPKEFRGRADSLEDKGFQEANREDLEKHGHSAFSQAKRDWFARNVPGSSKGDLVAQARGEVPVESPNGSGESSASREAISRVASEKANKVERFRIDTRSGKETPLIGVDAVDAKAGPYDRIVKRGPNGEEIVDEGPKARPTKKTPQVATNDNLEQVLSRATKGLKSRSAKAGD